MGSSQGECPTSGAREPGLAVEARSAERRSGGPPRVATTSPSIAPPWRMERGTNRQGGLARVYTCAIMSPMNNVVVTRTTSAGLLSIALDASGKLVPTLAGGALSPWLDKLAKPLVKDGKSYTHSIGGKVALTAVEVAAIEAARAAWAASPRGQRHALTSRLDDCDRGAYPGTKAAREESAALAALQAFDVAHPEVLAEIQAEHHERVLGGCDVGGL